MLTLLERLSISAKDREDWYRVMEKTASDGLPQVEVLQRLEKDYTKTKHPLGPLIRLLLARLSGVVSRPGAPDQRTVGTELNGLVPDGEATLIQAGVQSGNIAQGFQNAAEHVATQGKLKKAVIAALGKPVFYILGLLGLLAFFSIKVLPAFERGRPRDTWPSGAQLLGSIADHVWIISGGTVAAMVFATITIAYLTPNWTGTRREWADRHVFPFGLIAQIHGATFLSSLAGYISAGSPIADGVKNIAAIGSPYMASQCGRAIALLRDGRRFEECLVSLPIVHTRYHWLINVYGLSSDSAHAYKTISEEMTSRTLDFIKTLFDRVISNALLFAVGGVLMWIYLSMFAIADAGTKKRAALEPGFVIAAVVQKLPQGV